MQNQTELIVMSSFRSIVTHGKKVTEGKVVITWKLLFSNLQLSIGFLEHQLYQHTVLTAHEN